MDFDLIVEKLNEIAESQVDYETTHKDASDNYAYLVAECWSQDDESRLADYMTEKAIDWQGLEIDLIADRVLDCFEMESGHMWSAGNGGFLITSFAVGEIELQIELEELEIESFTPEICERLSRASDVYLRYDSPVMAYGYQGTDSVWDAVVSEKALRAIVADMHAESV